MSVIFSYFRSAGEVIGSVVLRWELLLALARRDMSDEYVDHKFARWWAYVMPLFAMATYLLVFTLIWPTRVTAPEGYSTDAIVYLLSGILPWLGFNQTVGRSVSAMVNNRNIVKQMAFPLELLALKSLIQPFVFMLVSLAFIAAYAGWVTQGAILAPYAWGVPLLLALSIVTFAGFALLFSALQVFMRDVKEFVTLFLTVGLYIHPILYLPGAIPEAMGYLLHASPLTYFIFCWQDILFYGGIHRPWAWWTAGAFGAVIFIVGARMFMGSKHHFGDFL